METIIGGILIERCIRPLHGNVREPHHPGIDGGYGLRTCHDEHEKQHEKSVLSTFGRKCRHWLSLVLKVNEMRALELLDILAKGMP